MLNYANAKWTAGHHDGAKLFVEIFSPSPLGIVGKRGNFQAYPLGILEKRGNFQAYPLGILEKGVMFRPTPSGYIRKKG